MRERGKREVKREVIKKKRPKVSVGRETKTDVVVVVVVEKYVQ